MDKKPLTLGSLFDGSGGFPLAGILSGIEPVWASEIEPFAVRVTTKRLPQMQHFGDISALHGSELPAVDIITFGSPCQDMSIAGKRSGLDGSRSSLFYEAIRIVKEMREATNGEKPRFIVWENVPGAFSSNKGEDFKAVLEAVIGVKEPTATVPPPEKKGWPDADCYLGEGWSVAYRVLDAQWWGVPQRRKRIFLVADFADQCAPEILFESEGLSGYSAESLRTWQRTACRAEEGSRTAGSGVDGYNGCLTGDVSSTIGENCGMSTGRNGVMVLNDQGGNRMDVTEDCTTTLRAEAHHPPLVMDETQAFHINQRDEGIDLHGVSGALMATRNTQMQTFVVEQENAPFAAGFCTEHSADARSIGYEEERSPTLRAGVVPAALAVDNHPADSRVSISEDGTVQTLTTRMGSGGGNVPMLMAVEERPVTLKIRAGGGNGGKGVLTQEDKSATLSCNNDQTLFVPMVYGISSFDSNAMKSDNPHAGIYEADTSRTLDGRGGDPSCNQGGVCICEPVVAIEGNGSRPSHRGDGFKESDAMYTLNTTEVHAVAFSEKAACLSALDGPKGPSSQMLNNPECNFVAEKTYAMTTGSFTSVEEEVAPTLMARDYKDPTVVNDHVYGYYPQMKTEGMSVIENQSPTLVNGTNPGYHNGIIEPDYTVRRLTPTECARLQGFPDWWCRGLATENPTDEELAFWSEVWETHRRLISHAGKPKTEKQIRKWLADPYSDAAEYKLWGNGLCLNIAYFVLSGIVWAVNKL